MKVELIRQPDLMEVLEREGRIERAQRNAYYETGVELAAIRDKHLYKVSRDSQVQGRYSFETFEEYCESRWELSRTRAFQIIEASALAAKMFTNVNILPVRESHIRPLLTRLQTDEERVGVWQQIVTEAPERITASVVEDYITRHIAARDKEWITLTEWQALDRPGQQTALSFAGTKRFNPQDGEEERNTQNVEWAQWTWNPVTGCKHDCPYCYARDIAHRFYPTEVGFAPALWPERLTAPANTPVPAKAAKDASFRNVFTCSMADLFGRWVPSLWIDAVLERVRQNPQWNFLFLTKFPKRLAEFTFPENAWIGTTVDCQARVQSAEDAFAKVQASVKWLSVEPMIEPLQFSRLELFDWLVIGGASPSTQTPEWRVPVAWWTALYAEAKQRGLQVYLKSNLYERERGYPGAPTVAIQVPSQFVYLKAKTRDEVVLGEKG